jgi:hypothetical protein
VIAIHFFRIKDALAAEFERDGAALADRHRAVEAGGAAGMAGSAHLLDLDPDRVLVAIDAHLDDALGPEVSPFRHSARRVRLKYHASPVAMVFASASAFMCATISTSPERASVATQVMSPSASNFGVNAVPSSSSAAAPGGGNVVFSGMSARHPGRAKGASPESITTERAGLVWSIAWTPSVTMDSSPRCARPQ